MCEYFFKEVIEFMVLKKIGKFRRSACTKELCLFVSSLNTGTNNFVHLTAKCCSMNCGFLDFLIVSGKLKVSEFNFRCT